MNSTRYHTTIYFVSRTNIDSRFEISVNVCATCKMDRSMAQKIKTQKTFHIKGKKESRKWRSGYAICQWCDISRFPWIDIANISQIFFFDLEINRCFAPPKTKKECQQHTVTIWSFLVLYQWPFYRFTHWKFNDVGNSVEKVQLLNSVKTVVKFCPVTLSVQTEQANW